MAIQSVAGDVHLSTNNPTGFTTSQQPFSITVWINAPWAGTVATPAAAASYVGMYGPATPTTALQIGCRGTGLCDCWTWGGGLMVSSPTALTAGLWYFIGYTYDGTNHRLYINGSQVNTTTTVQLAGQFTYVYINGYPTATTNEVSTHLVDSYSYYNRTLSADEVLTMYNAKGARHGNAYGLVAAYEFDELSAGSTVASVTDVSGNGNNLSVVGAGATPMTYAYAGAVASSNLRRVH